MAFLYLPITSYRPEEIRVTRMEDTQDHGFFVLELRNPHSGKWINQGEYRHLESAIMDALGWYRRP